MTPLVVARRPLAPGQALVRLPDRVLPAAIGRAGIAALKREGDGATPAGRIRPLAALWHPGGVGRALPHLPGRPAGLRDGWSDDPSDLLYNRFRRLPTPWRHERLLRSDRLYDIVVVTSHNQVPRVRGRGSAVFLHVAAPGLAPTVGCLAFEAAVWRRLGRIIAGRPIQIAFPPRPAGRGARAKNEETRCRTSGR